MTKEVAEQFGHDVDKGVVVIGVVPDSGADEAGVRPGDVIVAVDDQPVASVDEFLGRLRRADPGDEIDLTILREGKQRQVRVYLRERPSG